mmetsp:Transcript_23010/g.31967  ORF Transcript_23010/g.31967 Transcript_23010/m.31967 type:complete len:208 (-) Transcript_23010:76-699(-)|eukprot:CAMPEP_0196598312 /NCGR_PEP_ID=MMETSP1081-20130531/94247_1 /TAXON_ID=36882 /ORGANISM="Pyramimonas amylifera, Strain CCMP720" /LENGTH=207 /DNA_ID=CAMNT_0041923989 /DNA_START=211 /DNA_END=834 /DNA_ORIENTATION=-
MINSDAPIPRVLGEIELRGRGKQFINNPPKKGNLPNAFFGNCTRFLEGENFETLNSSSLDANHNRHKMGFMTTAVKQINDGVRETERQRDTVRKEIKCLGKNYPKALPPLEHAPQLPPRLPPAIYNPPSPRRDCGKAQWEDDMRAFKQGPARNQDIFYSTTAQDYLTPGGEILEMETKARLERLEHPIRKNEGNYFRIHNDIDRTVN